MTKSQTVHRYSYKKFRDMSHMACDKHFFAISLYYYIIMLLCSVTLMTCRRMLHATALCVQSSNGTINLHVCKINQMAAEMFYGTMQWRQIGQGSTVG